MGKDVIIALDFPTMDQTMTFLGAFGGPKPYVKVGMELFYAEGPGIVRRLKEEGYKVFLDLKLHDIPNTVKSAMSVLRGLGADMVNLHAAGTRAMMEAALEGLSAGPGPRPMLLAVTQLTSTSGQQLKSELLIEKPMEEVVARYAENAKAAGLDGVVCSPLEVETVKNACGSAFLTVTPGIRYSSGGDDQARVTTPQDARRIGSDYIVVGRPITRAENPPEAWRRVMANFAG